MTILDYIEKETSIDDLKKMAYNLCVDTDAQRLALRILQVHSIAVDLNNGVLNGFLEKSRQYVLQLETMRLVKHNLQAVDAATAGVKLPIEERFVYERTSDMGQLFKWLASLSQEDLYFVIRCAADVVTQVSGYTDIVKVINTALSTKAKNPMKKQEIQVCYTWLNIAWAAPERSTMRLDWPRQALNSMFGY